MTKTMKKSLVAVLVIVMAFACGMFAMQTSVAKADNTEAVTEFENYVNTNLKKADNDYSQETLFSDGSYITKVKAAKEMYVAGANSTVIGIYNKVVDATTEPFKLESYAVSILAKRIMELNGARFYYSQNDELVEYETLYNKYNDGTHVKVAAWLDAVPAVNPSDYSVTTTKVGVGANLAVARVKMNAIKTNIDTAISAIKNIQVFESNAMVAYSATTTTTYRVVLASQTSIGWKFDTANKKGVEDTTQGATKALNDIYGTSFAALTSEHATIKEGDVDYYVIYKNLITKLDAEYAKAVSVIDAIAGLSDLNKATNLYTNSNRVKEVRTAYDDLKSTENQAMVGSENKNNLQSLVSNYSVLTGLEGDITEISGKIDGAKSAINAITPVPVTYTSACKVLIDNARTAVNGLPADVKADDKIATYVTNYATLTTAEADYKAFQDEVDDAISAIKGLKDVSGSEFYGKFLEAKDKYDALDNGDQKTTVDCTAVVAAELPTGAPTTINNVNKLFLYYQVLAEAIWSHVNPVITAISNLTEPVTLDGDYILKVNAARAAYDALNATTEQPYVSNIDKLVRIERAISDATSVKEEWVTAVNAIETPITVTNWDKVATAEAKYAGLNSDIQSLLSSLELTAWTKFTTAKSDRDTLKSNIETIATNMGSLTTTEVTISDTFADDMTTWYATVTPVKTAFEALAADAQTYLATNYATQKANYDLAVANYAQYSVEKAIIDIGLIANITINATTMANINTAKATWDAYVASNTTGLDVDSAEYNAKVSALKVKVRNYRTFTDSNLNPNLVDALAEQERLTNAYKGWQDAVKAIAADSTAVDALTSVDLDKVIELTIKYYNFIDTTVTGEASTYVFNKTTGEYTFDGVENVDSNNDSDVVTYLATEKALLDAILDKAFTLITGSTTEMNGLVSQAAAPNFKPDADFIAALETANTNYNGLHTSQKNVENNLVNGAVASGDEEITALIAAHTAFENVYNYVTLAKQYAEAVDNIYNAIFDNGGNDGWWSMNASPEGNLYFSEGMLTDILILKSVYLYSNDYKAILKDSYDKLLLAEEKYNEICQGYYENGAPTDFEDYVFYYLAELESSIMGHTQSINRLSSQLASLKEQYEALDSTYATDAELAAAIAAAKADLQAKIEAATNRIYTLETWMATAKSEISALQTGLADFKTEVAGKYFTIAEMNAYKETVTAKFNELDTAINGINTDISTVKSDLNTYKTETNATLSALNAAIEKEKADRETADNKLAADIAANDKAINELLNSKVAQLNKTITIITVIFSVVMAGMIACTVILFLKKK